MSAPDARVVVDLLGALAYSELSAVSRLAADAEQAPSLAQRVAVVDLAVAEHVIYRRLAVRIEELGAEPMAAMSPFVAPVDAFHARTRAQDWYEQLVSALVGDAIATDFYRLVAQAVDPATAALVNEIAAAGERADVLADVVRRAVADDPRLGGRLSLWARRLVGEALSQVHRVLVDRPGLEGALVPPGAAGVAAVSELLTGLTDRHAARIRHLGLSP